MWSGDMGCAWLWGGRTSGRLAELLVGVRCIQLDNGSALDSAESVKGRLDNGSAHDVDVTHIHPNFSQFPPSI